MGFRLCLKSQLLQFRDIMKIQLQSISDHNLFSDISLNPTCAISSHMLIYMNDLQQIPTDSQLIPLDLQQTPMSFTSRFAANTCGSAAHTYGLTANSNGVVHLHWQTHRKTIASKISISKSQMVTAQKY